MLDSNTYTDGEWVRFQNGKPRKIGGFKWISSALTNTPRLLKQYFRNGFTNILIFHKTGVAKAAYDKSSFLSVTPESVLSLTETVLEDCEDAWNELVDVDTTVSLSSDSKVAVYSNKFVIAAPMAAGDIIATEVITSSDISLATEIRFWIKCSIATASGDLQLLLDETANCASPSETLNVPALVANTWTEVAVSLVSAAGDRDAIVSVGLKYAVDIGACDIYIDDIRAVLPTNSLSDWSAATMYDTVSGQTVLAAVLTYDLDNLEADTAGVLYKSTNITTLSSTAPLVVENATSVSGGCTVIGQFLFLYGSDGLIKNSDLNKPFVFTIGGGSYANETYVGDGQKIVYGAAIKSGAAPSGLFWSLTAVHKVTFTGGSTNWSYSTLSSEISILSKKSVVEYDGRYYWPGVDRFYVASSSGVEELPNTFNSNEFLTTFNRDHITKMWGTKTPRFGEIWWHYPSGTSTECDRAIIFNVKENCWHDIPISRSAGLAPVSSPFPIWADEDRLYLQEFGKNEITATQELTIRSSFTTNSIGFLTGSQDSPQVNTVISRIEPDFEQVGDMTVSTVTRRYANSPDEEGTPMTFGPTTEKVDIRDQSRILRLKFTSNTLSGDYWLGKTLLHLSPGDPRP